MYIGIIEHKDKSDKVVNIGSSLIEDQRLILNHVTDYIEKTLTDKFGKEIKAKIVRLPPIKTNYEPFIGGMYFSTEKGLENITISGDLVFSETKDVVFEKVEP